MMRSIDQKRSFLPIVIGASQNVHLNGHPRDSIIEMHVLPGHRRDDVLADVDHVVVDRRQLVELRQERTRRVANHATVVVAVDDVADAGEAFAQRRRRRAACMRCTASSSAYSPSP